MKIKKIFLALGLLIVSILNISADDVATQNRRVNENCCNSCQLDCTVAGCFTVGTCPINTLMPPGCGAICASLATDSIIQTISNAPIIKQCGSSFWVTPSPLNLDIIGSSGVIVGNINEYTVFLSRPFCTRVAVTATSSSGNARLSSIPTTNSSFILENILPGDTVCFIAMPINK